MNNNDILNVSELSDKLNKAQKRSRLLDTVLLLVNELEGHLNNYLYKKDQIGVEAKMTHYTNVANSYIGIPESTFVNLKKMRNRWKIVDVYRDQSVQNDIDILNLDQFKEQISYKIIKNNLRLTIEY